MARVARLAALTALLTFLPAGLALAQAGGGSSSFGGGGGGGGGFGGGSSGRGGRAPAVKLSELMNVAGAYS